MEQCCNSGLEPLQGAAFDYWKSRFGQRLLEMRTYLAQMLTRRMTFDYENASVPFRMAYDAASDSLQRAIDSYPKCMQTLLYYAAGMLCLMCDPQWNTFFYKRTPAEMQQLPRYRYTPGRQYKSISISGDTCAALWAACQDFSTRSADARRKILEAKVTKDIYAPMPMVEMFSSKTVLCSWARDTIALQPMHEFARATPKPTMPALPPDAITTPPPAVPWKTSKASQRRMADAVHGQTFLMVSMQHPSEVKLGQVVDGQPLELTEKLGSAELGDVKKVLVDTSGTQQYIYLVAVSPKGSDEIVQYKFTYIKGQTVVEAPTTVYPSLAKQSPVQIVRLQAKGGVLYIAASDGTIYRLAKAGLLAGTRSDGEPLYTTKREISGAHQRITGLAVTEGLFWSTATQVFMGPRDGPSGGKEQCILTPDQLTTMAGVASTIQDIQVSLDGTNVYMLAYAGGINQINNVYRFHPLNATLPVKLMWYSTARDLHISLALSHLYLTADRAVYIAPAPFTEFDVAKQILQLEPTLLQVVTDVGIYFVPGSDCVVGNWQRVGSCTRTCGGGLLTEERPVLKAALHGGKACPEQLSRQVDCNTVPCPVVVADCKMSQWMNQGTCTKTCDDGMVSQERLILRHSEGGGLSCPDSLVRKVPCRVETCGGLDHLALSLAVPKGMFSSRAEEIGTTLQVSEMPTESGAMKDVPDLLSVDSKNLYVYTAKIGSTSVLQWEFSIGDGNLISMFSPRPVWNAPDGNNIGVRALAHEGNSIFVATSDEKIMRLNGDTLIGANRGVAVSPDVLYIKTGEVRALSASFTYLAWASAVSATLGSTTGAVPGEQRGGLVTADYLRTMTGSSATEIIDLAIGRDGTRFYMLIWDTDAEILALFSCLVTSSDVKEPSQLQFTFPSRNHRLAMAPRSAYVYSDKNIWSAPLDLAKEQELQEVYRPSAVRIATIAHLFVRGRDCKLTPWQNTTVCSASCDGGIVHQARVIDTEPANGGRQCPNTLIRELDCGTMPCPIDCQMTPWIDDSKCSAKCGGGMLKQIRKVNSPAAHGGMRCPDLLKRTIACNTHPCEGVACQLSEWVNEGVCSKSCDAGIQKQTREILQHSDFGGPKCKGRDLVRYIGCNTTPCGKQGFNPVSAGRLTGFDFDVSQFCERPTTCAALNGGRNRPPASSSLHCLSRWAACLLSIVMACWHL